METWLSPLHVGERPPSLSLPRRCPSALGLDSQPGVLCLGVALGSTPPRTASWSPRRTGKEAAGGWMAVDAELSPQDKNTQLITQMAGSSLAGAHRNERPRSWCLAQTYPKPWVSGGGWGGGGPLCTARIEKGLPKPGRGVLTQAAPGGTWDRMAPLSPSARVFLVE